jgi:hypothetical protein
LYAVPGKKPARLCQSGRTFDAYLEAAIGETIGSATEKVKARAATPKEAPTRKDNPGGRGKTRANGTSLSRGSNNADYLTARIARDRPDVLERMKAGEFKSVRAAAVEAGIGSGGVFVKQPTSN